MFNPKVARPFPYRRQNFGTQCENFRYCGTQIRLIRNSLTLEQEWETNDISYTVQLTSNSVGKYPSLNDSVELPDPEKPPKLCTIIWDISPYKWKTNSVRLERKRLSFRWDFVDRTGRSDQHRRAIWLTVSRFVLLLLPLMLLFLAVTSNRMRMDE